MIIVYISILIKLNFIKFVFLLFKNRCNLKLRIKHSLKLEN